MRSAGISLSRLGALLTGSTLLLVGCASAPPARQPSPQVGQHGPAAASDHGAADSIDPRSSGPLSLEQLLAFAKTHGPTLTVAQQRAQLGEAEVEGAEVLIPYNPEISVSAGGRTVADASVFEFAATVEQRFEIAGQRGTRLRAAAQSRDARLAKLGVVDWEVHVLVHALYFKLLVQRAQLEAAGKLSTFANGVQAVIDKRVEAGEEAPLEAIVARAELARARQVVIAAKQAHQVTAMRLAEVVGWPGGTPLTIVGELPAAKPAPDLALLVSQAMDQHPSQRWLELELQAAGARAEREDRQAWPDPAIGLSYAREGSVGAPPQHVWMGTLRLPLPLWERNQRNRATAEAELGIARSNQQAFARRLHARIAGAHARVNAAAERITLYGRDILPAFERNLRILQRSFELGEIDILKLAQIQQRILQVQSDALKSLQDYFVAVAALEALSGVEVYAHLRGEAPMRGGKP